MADQTEIDKAGTAERVLHDFMDGKLSKELQQLRLRFREPLRTWFISLRDSVQRLKKEDEFYYNQTVTCLNDKMQAVRRREWWRK